MPCPSRVSVGIFCYWLVSHIAMGTSLLRRSPLSRRLLFAFVVVLTACHGSSTESALAQGVKPRAGGVIDLASLLDSLRAAGAGGAPVGEVDQPFLTIKGTMIKVRGEDVQVYQYPNAAAVDVESRKISRDGTTVGKSKIHWIGTPHFYKKERLLVLYLGDDHAVLKTLETVLGRQFAGK